MSPEQAEMTTSTRYRTEKFIRRHRLAVAVAAGAGLAVIGFAIRERIQATLIAREAQTAEQVSAFLVRLFEVSNPSLHHRARDPG